MIVLDHPAIRSAERTGYPDRSHQHLCPWCGEDIGEKSYGKNNPRTEITITDVREETTDD